MLSQLLFADEIDEEVSAALPGRFRTRNLNCNSLVISNVLKKSCRLGTKKGFPVSGICQESSSRPPSCKTTTDCSTSAAP